jgi:hypothetical protein
VDGNKNSPILILNLFGGAQFQKSIFFRNLILAKDWRIMERSIYPYKIDENED